MYAARAMTWQMGVTIYVRDSERAADFYRALGLDVGVSWQLGGTQLVIAQPRQRIPRWRIVLAPAEAYGRPPGPVPPNLFTLTLFPEPDDTAEQMIERAVLAGGRLIEGPSQEPVTVAIVQDPDGHHIIIGGT